MYQKFISDKCNKCLSSDKCNKCSFIKMNKTSKILVHVIHFFFKSSVDQQKSGPLGLAIHGSP